MRTDYIVTKFLADTNKNIKKVVEADKRMTIP